MLLNAGKCQVYSFYRFWVIKEKPRNQGGGGVKLAPPPAQIRVNGLTLLKYDSIVRLLRDVFGHGRVP